MKRLILSLLAVCLLWMANAQNPAWGSQSKVVTDSIYSQVLKAHRAYTIYLPQSYSNETDRKDVYKRQLQNSVRSRGQ